MRGNAYNQGLQLAESARGTNLGAQATGLGTQQGYISQGLGVGQGILGLGEDQRQFDTSARLQGNAQLGQSAQLGYQGAQVAQGIGTQNGQSILGAGQVLQDDANAQNGANYQAWLGNDQRANDLLQRYWDIVGSGAWGKTESVKAPYSGASPIMSGVTSGVGAFGSMFGMCWVAREVYGVDSPKWMQFRGWMLTKSPRWFYKLYEKHRERFAAFISDKPRLKSLVRFIFNKILENADIR
ncbi:hypothetical protein [Azospirillum argentinense]|uniref:hypothetical protein n=1 Tax=Azospirillum argentinense TaxID=2970906 RepID=UPI0032DF2A87